MLRDHNHVGLRFNLEWIEWICRGRDWLQFGRQELGLRVCNYNVIGGPGSWMGQIYHGVFIKVSSFFAYQNKPRERVDIDECT